MAAICAIQRMAGATWSPALVANGFPRRCPPAGSPETSGRVLPVPAHRTAAPTRQPGHGQAASELSRTHGGGSVTPACSGLEAAFIKPLSAPLTCRAGLPRTAACSPPALRRRPSSTHAGIASGSAPALRHSAAAWRASGSSSSPSLVPSKIPATSASRSARPPASSRSAATAAASSSPVSSRHFARCRASPVRSARRGSGQPAGDYRSCIRVSLTERCSISHSYRDCSSGCGHRRA